MSFPTLDPLIPSSLWLALAAGAVTLWLWYARRRPAAIAPRRWTLAITLMAMGMAIVLYVLLNPTWVDRVPPPEGKPVLTVLVDATSSMGTNDSGGGRSRYAAAVEAAAGAIDALSNQFEVRVMSFADGVTVSDMPALTAKEPAGASTDLATALVAGLQGDLPQGQAVLLLSDGVHNVGGAPRVLQAVRAARAMGAPVYTQTFGGDKSQFDIAVEVRSAQDIAFVKQKVPLTVRVRQAGAAVSSKVELRLIHEGKTTASHTIDLTPNQSADAHFMVSHDEPGTYFYEVSAPVLPGEASQANNTGSYLLRVVNEPIRVLVLEGKPYWDSKFFLRTLSTDPAVALDTVVKMTEGRYIRRTLSGSEPAAPDDGAAKVEPGEALPRTEKWGVLTDVTDVLGGDKLRGYQIVVLGRDADAYLTEASLVNLTNWIAQEGGSLVCYRGAPTAQVNQKLSRLMPVKWTPARESRVRMKLTDRGQELQWGGSAAQSSLLELPSLASAAQVDASKALAVILATAVGGDGEEAPAVVYQPYGSGRVVVIEGSGMWRWAFLPPAAQGRPSEELYGSLWHSLLRWLVSGVGLLPGQNVLLRTDKVAFSTTESATLTLLMREESAKPPQVELLADGSTEAHSANPTPIGDEPGSYRINLGKLAEGRYTARIAGAPPENTNARTVFTVRAISDEQIYLAARPDLMDHIAKETGGVMLAGSDARQIAQQFDQFLEKTRPAMLRRSPAWDRWWVLVAILLLWTSAWAVRRRGGLV
ncbi:MAG: vWA domain-containing protein [Phycisphaeraceae bacterium]